MSRNLPAAIKNAAVELLPDSDRYKCRVKVKSSSSSSLHLVSFDNAPGAGYWTCSCFGNRRYGQCHHLTDMGLRGRKYGRQSLPEFVRGELAMA